jgi:multicomponent Na+:H+ antiporter subunit G
MTPVEWVQLPLLVSGALFFVTGTLGLLRFPDVYTRLHALTKADNLGLGLIVVGLIIGSDSLAAALKLLLVWLLAMAAGATGAHLVARRARELGVRPWERGT